MSGAARRQEGESHRRRQRGWVVLEAVPDAWAALLDRLLPDPLGAVRRGQVLRESMSRATARLDVPGLGSVLVKAHRMRRLADRLPAFLRRSRARKEWDAGRYLAAAGIPVARPLAVGERRSHALLESAFFAAEYVDGLRTFEDVMRDLAPGAERAALARAARLIRSLHDRAFDHRDLHAGNVLADDSGRRLLVVDLHRMRVGRTVPERARLAALARWLHSLAAVVGPGGRLRTLAAYAPGADRAERRRRYATVQEGIARLEWTRRRSRAKRCFLESTVYTRDVGDGWGARRRAFSQARLEAALQEHDEALRAGDERVAKRARKARVTCHGDVVVKESLPYGLAGRLKDLLAPGRHRAGYRGAHVLDVLAVGTARPMAWVRRSGRVFALYEDLSSLDRLDHLTRRIYAEGDRTTRRRLGEASARWLGGLHRRGIYHGDVKAVNIRVREAADTFEFRLIDTDRVRVFRRGVDRRRRVKNLAQLAASIPTVVTKTDRLRWFRRYADVSAFAGEERRLARDVAAALARKIVVVDEPIE